ncbi:UNVERIFIED_CONTAM: Pectin acetylesterase 11 [Sesamum radiatum]|uniref:Pectin acetylesterase n=1 Tax=Sesamum radiatum TaxID=300843 RepID=A0AAW2QEV3_SESRA
MADHWFIRPLIICFLMMMMSSQVRASDWTNIITPESAISKGAVCLDGSPPVYYFKNGSGDGTNNWLIYLEGGGWCVSNKGCLDRTKIYCGTSTLKPKRLYFTDILSEDQTINPDFYDWNKVFIAYCDSSSYLGDVEENTYPNRRGARIFDLVMEDLLAKGMKDAKNAILSGGSAGGLGTILHCDGFRSLIPTASRVKCISDADYRTALLKTLREVANSPSTGILVHSCYRHGHFMDQGWCANSPALRKKINMAIADWYFDRRSVQEIDTQTELPRNCTKLT